MESSEAENGIRVLDEVDHQSRWRRLPTIAAASLAAVGLTATFRPDLMLNKRLPTGGDLGASHYIPAAYRQILPWRLTGWASGWFAGLPLMQFYFPLPYIAIVALSSVVPYPIAFKIVATAGVASIPVSLYAFARMTGGSRPVAAFGLIFGLVFIYNESYTILGGNIGSTMAGEFAYAASLSVSIILLAIAYRRALITRTLTARSALLPAVLLTIAVLSHVLPLAVVGVGFATLVPGRGWVRRLVWIGATGVTGMALAGAWLTPLVGRLGYTAKAAWTPVRGIAVFAGGPACADSCRWSPVTTAAVILASLAPPIAIARKNRVVGTSATIAIAGLVGTLTWPSAAVFNQRWIPVFYVGVAMCAAYAAGSMVDWISDRMTWSTFRTASVVALTGVAIGATAMITSQHSSSWVNYNYSGYEAKPGWNEYQDLMTKIRALPDDRILWEYSPEYQKFGTTRALELIPYWTGHRSMEGLLIESSISSPAQFVMQAEVSERGSGAVPGIAYPPFDFEAGTRHMESFGIRYFIAWSDVSKSAATAAGLEEIADAGQFAIFELATAGEVAVPEYQPLVAPDDGWHERSLEWWSNPETSDVPLVFPRIGNGPEGAAIEDPKGAALKALPESGVPVRVRVEGAQDASVQVKRPADGVIEFTTNRVGAPHIVRESYFPTWRVEGGEGPYMVAPSLMLVYPTEERVRLVEKAMPLDYAGMAITVLALALMAAVLILSRRDPVERNNARVDRL